MTWKIRYLWHAFAMLFLGRPGIIIRALPDRPLSIVDSEKITVIPGGHTMKGTLTPVVVVRR